METFQRDKTFSSSTSMSRQSEKNRLKIREMTSNLEICEVVETKVMEGDDGWTLEEIQGALKDDIPQSFFSSH